MKLYGQLDDTIVDEAYYAAWHSRSLVPYYSNFQSVDHPPSSAKVSNLLDNGYCTFDGIFDRKSLGSLYDQTLQSVFAEKSIAKVRDHSAETTQEIARGIFKYRDIPDDPRELQATLATVSVAAPLQKLPELSRLIFDERIIELASRYYNAVPLLTYVKVTVSFPNSLAPKDTQFFHCDFGSKKILKVIVYLGEDNTETSDGPFAYVRYSHLIKPTGWDSKSRYDDAEIQMLYPADDIIELTAKAGDIIFADTTGFHKGKKPTRRVRVALIFNFCLHPEIGFQWLKIDLPKSLFYNLSPLQRSVVSDEIFNIC